MVRCGCCRYVGIKFLGSGKHGVVVLAKDNKTDQLVAVKLLKRGDKLSKNVRNEIVNHSLLQHPHVIKLNNVFLHGEYLCVAMEYASVSKLFETRGRK